MIEAASTNPVRLDLACGQNPREGFRGVDKFAPNAEKVDLLKFPWPWEDNSIDELHCSHFIEHIPMAETEQGKDLFLAFFDEAYRVLKPEGVFTVICPCARNNRAFQDPTHRRFIVAETFLYLNRDWRKMNGLDHYLGECNFAIEVNHTMLAELGTLHPEVQARRFNESWNTIVDWHARLVAKK